MAKIRYHFNTKSLEIVKAKRTTKDILNKIFSYSAAGMIMAVIVVMLAYKYFPSPREKHLQRELSQYELQFDMMNKKLDHVTKVMGELQDHDDNIYRVIFEAEPISSDLRNAGIGGADRYEDLKGYDNAELLIQTRKRLDKLTRQMVVQSQSFDEIFVKAKDKEKMLACIPAIQPISNADLSRFASGYGYRIHPFYKSRKMHWGVDLSAPRGTPLYATGDGKISYSSRKSGYGKTVMINHGYGYETLYGHMQKIIVRTGQNVKRGELIGYVGNTGLSKAPHVHYEVIRNGVKVNPIDYFYRDLEPADYEKLREIASRENESLS